MSNSLKKCTRKLSEAQKVKMIPGGQVSKERSAKGNITTEVIAENTSGEILVARQRRQTPVDRLREAGAVGEEELKAASAFVGDYSAAYQSCQNVLASLHVDHSGGIDGLIRTKLRQATRGMRFYAALRHLGSELSKVVIIGILDAEGDKRANGAFAKVGIDCLPNAQRAECSGAGKGTLVIALRELAIYYGYRKPASLALMEAA